MNNNKNLIQLKGMILNIDEVALIETIIDGDSYTKQIKYRVILKSGYITVIDEDDGNKIACLIADIHDEIDKLQSDIDRWDDE